MNKSCKFRQNVYYNLNILRQSLVQKGWSFYFDSNPDFDTISNRIIEKDLYNEIQSILRGFCNQNTFVRLISDL
jgi:hypothetical protein